MSVRAVTTMRTRRATVMTSRSFPRKLRATAGTASAMEPSRTRPLAARARPLRTRSRARTSCPSSSCPRRSTCRLSAGGAAGPRPTCTRCGPRSEPTPFSRTSAVEHHAHQLTHVEPGRAAHRPPRLDVRRRHEAEVNPPKRGNTRIDACSASRYTYNHTVRNKR
jgi:hypothetical protein